jgi:phosphoglycolate phosphatase-like HAD superfamily hydrolase
MDLSRYQLIIFDKDGTLIDFDAMWAGWIEEFARRLEAGTGLDLAADYFDLMGYDSVAGRTLPGGHLAVDSMAEHYALAVGFLKGRGLLSAAAETAVAAAWFIPDPVTTARPFADLPSLFGRLRAQGLKLAVATTDDRVPTLATLAALGVAGMIDQVVCADDGVPRKPAPEMVLAACRATGVDPRWSVVIGDSLVDIQMARAAGALAVGVLTGVSPAATLEPLADLVLASIQDLVTEPIM